MNPKKELFAHLPDNFKCPVTGLEPENEEQLSALIALYWQRNLIDWGNVNLYPPAVPPTESVGKAETLFSGDGVICCEYPLFADEPEDIKNHGGMKADIMYVTKDSMVLIENKIGSTFTYAGTQLDRQANYLKNSNIKNRHLVLLSSKRLFDKKWYIDKLVAAEEKHGIKGYLVHLEEVFSATAAWD